MKKRHFRIKFSGDYKLDVTPFMIASTLVVGVGLASLIGYVNSKSNEAAELQQQRTRLVNALLDRKNAVNPSMSTKTSKGYTGIFTVASGTLQSNIICASGRKPAAINNLSYPKDSYYCPPNKDEKSLKENIAVPDCGKLEPIWMHFAKVYKCPSVITATRENTPKLEDCDTKQIWSYDSSWLCLPKREETEGCPKGQMKFYVASGRDLYQVCRSASVVLGGMTYN